MIRRPCCGYPASERLQERHGDVDADLPIRATWRLSLRATNAGQ